jgi:hypothetical protein
MVGKWEQKELGSFLKDTTLQNQNIVSALRESHTSLPWKCLRVEILIYILPRKQPSLYNLKNPT